MNRVIVACCILLCTSVWQINAQDYPFRRADLPVEERVEDLVRRMTLEEKIDLLAGYQDFYLHPCERLGIPAFKLADGPLGVASWGLFGKATAFPSALSLAASWNRDLAARVGDCYGQEWRARGIHFLLAPGVNTYRASKGARNFEYMGEDPYLASKMVVPYIKGVQSNGVAACVKHYALNNHEVNRHTTNAIVDDRALYEIYLPAFKAAVQDGGAWTIMGSYNLYKDQHVCHNQYLLNNILKGEWGFDGVVVSDWGGTHDTKQAIANGLDMEFGSWTNGLSNGTNNAYDNYYLAMPYLKLIKEGKVGTKELDDKVRRILRLAFRTTMNTRRPFGSLCSPEHTTAARNIGEEGIVLLKNDRNLLPINPDRVKKIAVIGENALKMMTVGGGSSSLKVKYELSPLDGVRKRFGDKAEIVYARGYVGDTSGEYNGVVTGQNLNDDRTAEEILAEAIETAKNADIVIFVGGLNKSAHQDCEDSDRAGLELPYNQDKVISALAKANKNLVVVNISGNAVAMPWVKEVPAIVQAWYLGTECGNAIASILAGDVNPSGKLPMTFPVSLTDVGAHFVGDYPGTPRNDGSQIVDCNYSEGIYVGYRWNDKNNIKPLFPFGHGLSYTTFKYGKPSISSDRMATDGKITISIPVSNTGSRTGAEVVQLYITDVKSSLPRPVKELKDFKKVSLEPNQSIEIQFEITPDKLMYFDDERHEWVAEAGDFIALIGSSSSDIKDSVKFKLLSDTTKAANK